MASPPVRESRIGPVSATALGLTVVAVVGWVDAVTGRDLSVAVFYLPGVFVATWFGGTPGGLVVAACATVAWLLAELFGGSIDFGPLVPLWNALGMLSLFAAGVAGVAKLKGALQRERALSRADPTTGVANARAFAEAAGREIERARRSGRPFSLVFADCDDFKAVNDTYGHTAGDTVLRSVAQRIRDAVREVDLVARMGGDEFAVLMPETDEAGARAAVEPIRAALRERPVSGGAPVTLSLGLATFAGGWPSVEEALRVADQLMYLAKGAGKDTFRSEIFRTGRPWAA